MKRAAVAAIVLWGIGMTGSARSATPPGADGLTLVASKQIDARLLQVTFSTNALAAPTNVRILLPVGFDGSGRTRYPVLYLLHGGTGSYLDWTVQGDAETITAAYPVIVVMPDGGGDGNYVDWYNQGAGGSPEWETYHIGQLLPWVDNHFPTVASRAARAIAGLSMGGAGASHYAARHPDLFAAMGAFSGAVDTNDLGVIPVTELSGGPAANAEEGGFKPPGAVYGDRLADEIRWRGDNAWDLAQNLRGLTLDLATGDGGSTLALPPALPDTSNPCHQPDFVEADVHHQELDLHQALQLLDIAHTWDDYGPGCHSWPYWQRDLRTWMPMMMATFAHPVPPPSPFSFKAAEPSYDVYGWSVRIDRPAMEWSVLSDASPHGFTLSGSGSATVRVPGFAPGVGVPITNNGHPQTVTAGPDGRLAIRVDLGPGNPFQQYTLPAQVAGTRVGQATVTIAS